MIKSTEALMEDKKTLSLEELESVAGGKSTSGGGYFTLCCSSKICDYNIDKKT